MDFLTFASALFVLCDILVSNEVVTQNPPLPNHPVTHYHTLVYSHGFASPDNFKQEVILTNGQFPSPTIRVRHNDTLVIDVVNRLRHGFALHFHGLLQRGTVDSDGVPEVTQMEIPPNGTYKYALKANDQIGTFIYHAHTRLDLVWAHGALIIEPEVSNSPWSLPEYRYDEEFVVTLTQCWHTSIDTIYDSIVGAPFQDIPDTKSILINGRSFGEWDDEQGSASGHSGKGYEVFNVQASKTYLFRVIGLGVDSMLTFRVDNHTMTIIEVDGILVTPVETDHLEINAAQRYSVLITMNETPGNYWIYSEMIPGPGPLNGKAVLHYTASPESPKRTQIFEGESLETELTEWVTEKLHPSSAAGQSAVYSVPEDIDVELIISSFQRVSPDNKTQFDINGQLFRHHETPLLHQLRSGQNLSTVEPLVFELIVGQKVQIIFQNRFSDEGECEQHPWHMHGHTFYIVGHGFGQYSPEHTNQLDTNVKLRKNQFPFRDVATLYPRFVETGNETKAGDPCGWMAVRFLVTNPGLWLVHCHITAHMLMGKKFVLYEHDLKDVTLKENMLFLNKF